MSNHSVTETVRAIGKINLTSAGYSLIPWPWYEHVTITKKNRYNQEVKYPDLLGLTILSYVVYWYTPTVDVDEVSQRTNTPRRKFKADKLQCGYQELMNRFHASKEQVRLAVGRLSDAGMITVELRTVHTKQSILSNVMFIEPIPARIAEISTPPLELTTTLPLNRQPPSPSIDDHPPLQLKGTYTNASTNASTEIGEEEPSPSGGGKAPPPELPSKTTTARKTNGSMTPAGKEFFQQFKRKRWSTPQQQETFENTEAQVGSEIMLRAVAWAANLGIAKVPAICKTAKKIAGQDNGAVKLRF